MGITSKLKSAPQKGWVQGADKSNSATWKVSPLWPLKLSYLILEVYTESYKWIVIGYPSRSYAWIMARTPQMDEGLYNDLKQRLVDKHQYSLEGLRKVPQHWTKAEREKRGLTTKGIPDNMLASSYEDVTSHLDTSPSPSKEMTSEEMEC